MRHTSRRPASGRVGLAAMTVAAMLTLGTPAANAQPSSTPSPSAAQSGPAVGDGGAALVVLQAAPAAGSATGTDARIGLAAVATNTAARPASDRSVARAAAVGLATGTPTDGAALAQNAPADNPRPTEGSLDAALGEAADVTDASGSAHARWGGADGPCLPTINTSRVAVGGLDALPLVPALPDDLPPAASPELVAAVDRLPGSLSTLGGLLGGERGGFVQFDDAASADAMTGIVEVPGRDERAIQARSTIDLPDLTLLGGVLSVDTSTTAQLTVTAVGDPGPSAVDYVAPAITVRRGGTVLLQTDPLTADPQNPPTLDLRLVLPAPGPQPALPELLDLDAPLDPGSIELATLRIVVGQALPRVEGTAAGVSANALRVELVAAEPVVAQLGIPASLVTLTLGEQVARAAVPSEGVDCAGQGDLGPVSGVAGDVDVPGLDGSGAQYATVPLVLGGIGLLLVGGALVVVFRRRAVGVVDGEIDDDAPRRRPSPRPRD